MSKVIGRGRYATETYPPSPNDGGGASRLDQHIALGLQNDVSGFAAGDYYVLSDLFFLVLSGTTFDPVIGSASPAIPPLFLGPEVLPGRIGSARVGRAFDPTTEGSDNAELQWTVDGVPKGNVVNVPWDIFATLGGLTFAQALPIASGVAVDFGNVTWNAGQVVLLRATFGNVVGSGQIYITTTFDKLY